MLAPKTVQPAVTMSTLAVSIGLALVLQVAAAGGFLGTLIHGELSLAAGLLMGLTWLFSSVAILSGFAASLQPDSPQMTTTLASLALAFAAACQLNQTVHPLDEATYLVLNLCGQLAFTYTSLLLLAQLLKISGLWARLPQRLGALALLAYGGLGVLAQSWIPLSSINRNLGLVRDTILCLAPLVMAICFGCVKTLRLNPNSALDSIRLRLPTGPDLDSRRRTLLLAVAGAAASLALNTTWTFIDHGPLANSLLSPLLAVGLLSWLGCCHLTISSLKELSHERRQSQIGAKLASASALRFMARYADQSRVWAATIGLKTANFVVDHDPGGQLQAALPASILQIRSEEIQRCVKAVLGPLELHNNATAHLVCGAIDPEAAIRPCVDALKMFACLYLDAAPLVERRIKGLVSLLPIVDPGLGRVLEPMNIASLIRRNQWFFHFDFDWIDQQMTHTAHKARYDVQIATLPPLLRSAMMDYLAKHGGIGNFVWLGPQARERLLQEAPAMLSVIEPCPIPTGGAGTSQVLMFIVRFEQLIPRLQRYFDLDTMRKALFDFEPSEASSRIHRLLALQLSNAQSPSEIIQVLAQISSVAWRGFKEKDHALQLILTAHRRLNGASAEVSQELLNAVMAIGYPSQIMHHAQIDKIALRDIERLKTVALSPHHPRFEEAWIVLSTTDYQRHSPAERRSFLAFLRDAGQRSRIAKQTLAQVKAIDALAALARSCEAQDLGVLQDTLAALYAWLARVEASANILCLLLDAHLFIKGQLYQDLKLPVTASTPLVLYVAKLKAELGASHPQFVALNARWLELGMDDGDTAVTRAAS